MIRKAEIFDQYILVLRSVSTHEYVWQILHDVEDEDGYGPALWFNHKDRWGSASDARMTIMNSAHEMILVD